jgi:hypothetical protein
LASAIFGKGRSGGGINLRTGARLTRGPGVSATAERERKARRSRELAGPAAGLAGLGPKRDAGEKKTGRARGRQAGRVRAVAAG